jgi:hypothetical protein
MLFCAGLPNGTHPFFFFAPRNSIDAVNSFATAESKGDNNMFDWFLSIIRTLYHPMSLRSGAVVNWQRYEKRMSWLEIYLLCFAWFRAVLCWTACNTMLGIFMPKSNEAALLFWEPYACGRCHLACLKQMGYRWAFCVAALASHCLVGKKLVQNSTPSP